MTSKVYRLFNFLEKNIFSREADLNQLEMLCCFKIKKIPYKKCLSVWLTLKEL